MRVFVSLLLLSACDPTTAPKDTQGEEETGEVGVDADQDGWEYPVDCDDEVSTTYPGADEVCDDVDNDCDDADALSSALSQDIVTFDDPRADKPSTPTIGLPSTTVNWQNRWRIDCE